MATAYPPYPVRRAQNSQDLSTAQWFRFEIFIGARATFHGLGKKLYLTSKREEKGIDMIRRFVPRFRLFTDF